jgi:LPXTG-site transpeptidase (sortase) family protein
MKPGESDLDNLSVADLESLLAEKRRNDSKRMLRTIAERAPGTPVARPLLRPARLSTPDLAAAPQEGVEPSSVAASAAVGATAPRTGDLLMPPRAERMARTYTPVRPPDRFRRSGLAGDRRPPAPRGPRWLHGSGISKSLDRTLQFAELGFLLLLVYVIGQWLFADSEVASESSIQAEMQNHALASVGSTLTTTATLTNTVVPSGSPTLVPVRNPNRAVVHDPDNVAGEHDPILQAMPPVGTGGAALAGSLPGTTGSPTPDAVESDPALATELRIPKIKLDARVREVDVQLDTWEWEVADFMAGHHTGTANPGDTGNVVIAGHRDIRGKIFYNLDKLKPGDDIYVYSGRGTFHYVVRTTKTVLPTTIQVMAPTTDARLTLITCTPVKIASHRLIVIADLDPNYTAPASGR